MVKFNLRIFRSCQTKGSSTPSKHSCEAHKVITGATLPCKTAPPTSKEARRRSCFKNQLVSSAFGCSSKAGNRTISISEDFQSHVSKLYDDDSPLTKNYNSSATASVISDDKARFQIPLLPEMPPFHKKKNRHNKVKSTRNTNATDISTDDNHRFTTSYTVGDGGEDEGQPEILMSSPTSLSSEQVRTRDDCGGGGDLSPEWGTPARLSVFKKLMPCKVEGKVKESFAVVKRSENPYKDFKKSMMEMIVQNQMYEESELKQLLQCFLSLNSWYHHGVIVEAFSDILNNFS